MNKSGSRLSVIGLPLAFAAAAGCESSGLSPREAGNQTVADYTMALYDPAPFGYGVPAEALPAGGRQAAPLRPPIKVAVAQIGEVAPPASFLQALEKHPDLFSRVEGIPGPMAAVGQGNYRVTQEMEAALKRRTAEEGEKVRRLAKGMGMDYLLLVGGTIDHGTQSTGWTAADITIIGAFIAPSKRVIAEAKSHGSLMDLAADQVVLTGSGHATQEALTSTAAQDEGRVDTVRKVRDEVLLNLAADIIQEVQSRLHAAVPPAQ